MIRSVQLSVWLVTCGKLFGTKQTRPCLIHPHGSPIFLYFPKSYGHLPVISGYKWGYTFYKWGFLSTYN